MASGTVAVTNLTDAPGRTPRNIDIFNASLAPGEQVLVPEKLITDKLRRLDEAGQISLGSTPEWYRRAMRGIKSRMTKEEAQQFLRDQGIKKDMKAKANAAAKAYPTSLAVMNIEGVKKLKMSTKEGRG